MNPLTDDISDLLAGYITGDLDPGEQERCRQLLATHPELEAELAALESTLGLVINTFVTEDPPPELRQRILSQLDHTSSNIIRLAPQRPHPLQNWRLWTQGVAAALVLGLGIQNLRLHTQLAQTEMMLTAFQSPQAQVVNLAGMTDPNAMGRIMFDTTMQQASLAFHNLPVAEEDQVYRLWAVVGSKLVPCGEALPADQSSVVMNIPIPPDLFAELYDPDLQGFRLTLEAAPDMPAPTGDLILQSV